MSAPITGENFESIVNAIPVDIIKEFTTRLNNEQLQIIVAYFFCNELKGSSILVPSKVQHRYIAFLLLDLQMEKTKIEEVFINEIGLDKRTIRKYFKEYDDEHK